MNEACKSPTRIMDGPAKNEDGKVGTGFSPYITNLNDSAFRP